MKPTSHKGYTGREMSRAEAWYLLQAAVQQMEQSAMRADQVMPFEALVSNSDAIRLHGLGVQM